MKIFTGFLLILSIAGCTNPANRPHPEALKLFTPKDDGADSVQVTKPEHVFTVILSGSNKIYYYSGEFNRNAVVEKTDFKEFREILLNKKNDLGHHIVVLIKGDAKASYKNTVDMLDEMLINDIKKYALVDLTDAEAELLGLSNKMAGPGYGHAGTPPKEEPIYENKKVLLIALDQEGKISYGFGKGTKQQLSPLAIADSAILTAKIKELISGQSDYEILVKGDNEASFPTFKVIIQALKANELFNFKMVTAED